MNNLKLLVVEDDPLFGEAIVGALEEAGYQTKLAVNGAKALEMAVEESFDMIIQDIKLPDADGLDILKEFLVIQPRAKALVMTGHGTIDRAVDAMKLGACDFLTKPFPVEVILAKLQKALKVREMELEIDRLRKQVSAAKHMISRSPAMKGIMEMVHTVAPTDATVLIQGESGTGKELLADAIHGMSRRAERLCVKVNCAAIPETLMESELFGVERGAFTGADRSRPGFLESASGGTLFLDEIGEIPLHLQGKLLRALDEKMVCRVGSTRSNRTYFRLIAATNRNLETMVTERRFREDLFFRLNVVPVTLPPLRERQEDIPLLIAHFLENLKSGGKPISFLPETIDLLCRYDYPGNIRELQNIVEQLSVLYPGETIRPRQVPVGLRSNSLIGSIFERFPVDKPLKEAVTEFEQRYIEKVIKGTAGNKSRAAHVLGLSRKVLWEKLKRKSDD